MFHFFLPFCISSVVNWAALHLHCINLFSPLFPSDLFFSSPLCSPLFISHHHSGVFFHPTASLLFCDRFNWNTQRNYILVLIYEFLILFAHHAGLILVTLQVSFAFSNTMTTATFTELSMSCTVSLVSFYFHRQFFYTYNRKFGFISFRLFVHIMEILKNLHTGNCTLAFDICFTFTDENILNWSTPTSLMFLWTQFYRSF